MMSATQDLPRGPVTDTVITASTDVPVVTAAIAANCAYSPSPCLVAHGTMAGNVTADVAVAQGISAVTSLGFLASEVPDNRTIFAEVIYGSLSCILAATTRNLRPAIVHPRICLQQLGVANAEVPTLDVSN